MIQLMIPVSYHHVILIVFVLLSVVVSAFVPTTLQSRSRYNNNNNNIAIQQQLLQVSATEHKMVSRFDIQLSMTASSSSSSSSVVDDASSSMKKSQLEQLASMTTLSIDSGDLNIIQQYANTGYITDATTNPLFVSQAGLNTNDNPIYTNMIQDAIQYAIENIPYQQSDGTDENSRSDNILDIVALAIDRLAVNLGQSISQIVTGYVSTEVDPRLSFDIDGSVERALRIIQMYKDLNIPSERILIKLAATWEGIQAGAILQKKYHINCNLTLVFSKVQAIACAQNNIHLISPFPGRVLDYYNTKKQRLGGVPEISLDEGVMECKDIYNYYKIHNYNTICMPASWRPSRGTSKEEYVLDEIIGLAGSDRMTIPAPLLAKLATNYEVVVRQVSLENAQELKNQYPLLPTMDEKDFRYRMNMDGCVTEKLADGLRIFISETEKLEKVMKEKIISAISVN